MKSILLKFKKIIYWLLLLIFSLVIVVFIGEMISLCFLQYKNFYPSESFKSIYLRNAQISKDYKFDGPRVYKRRVAHPFFGFTYKDDGNNYGFLDQKDFPYIRAPDEYVIGVFGGSTAMHWAQFIQSSESWKSLKTKDHKKIVVLNFAIAGMKQPQQFYVASQFIEYINTALLFDGWNEVATTYDCKYPMEYPEDYEILFSTDEKFEDISRLASAERIWRVINSKIAESFLSSSATVFSLWTLITNNFKLKEFELKQSLSRHVKTKFTSRCNQFAEDAIESAYKSWQKYYLFFRLLAENQKVHVFHFLQPNPFMKNVKPLSLQENAIVNYNKNKFSIYNSIGWRAELFHNFYLANKTAQMTDLSYIFAQTTHETYIDPFTHLNDYGYKMVSDRVLRVLSSNGVVDPVYSMHPFKN